jgi:hypothetical protein
MIGQPCVCVCVCVCVCICVCVDVVSRVGLNSTINMFCAFGVGTSGGVRSARSVRVRRTFFLGGFGVTTSGSVGLG